MAPLGVLDDGLVEYWMLRWRDLDVSGDRAADIRAVIGALPSDPPQRFFDALAEIVGRSASSDTEIDEHRAVLLLGTALATNLFFGCERMGTGTAVELAQDFAALFSSNARFFTTGPLAARGLEIGKRSRSGLSFELLVFDGARVGGIWIEDHD